MNRILDWISEFEMQILIDAETNKDYLGQTFHHDEHDTTQYTNGASTIHCHTEIHNGPYMTQNWNYTAPVDATQNKFNLLF